MFSCEYYQRSSKRATYSELPLAKKNKSLEKTNYTSFVKAIMQLSKGKT